MAIISNPASFDTNLVELFSPERNPALKFACRLCRSSPGNTSHIWTSRNEHVPQLDQVTYKIQHAISSNRTILSTELQRVSELETRLTFPDAPSPKSTNLSWWSVAVSSSESDILFNDKQQLQPKLSAMLIPRDFVFVVTSRARQQVHVQKSRGLKW